MPSFQNYQRGYEQRNKLTHISTNTDDQRYLTDCCRGEQYKYELLLNIYLIATLKPQSNAPSYTVRDWYTSR